MLLYYQLLILALLLADAALVRRNLADYARPAPAEPGEETSLVSVLVPARNEAHNIEPCLAGILAQDYPHLEILVLDDGSTDDTASRVERMVRLDARVQLVRGEPLPAGWAGKTHACWQLARHARGDWLLFLDADTRHSPPLVATAVSRARAAGATLLSTFPRQEAGTLGEALTVPFIYWILFTLLPLRAVWERPEPAFAAACGQFLLVNRVAYLASGGHGAIPGSLHDGVHLARLMKAQGHRVVLADLSAHISCRMYHGWSECWSGFSRNAYQALGSLPTLIAVSALEVMLFLMPFVFAAWGLAAGLPSWALPVLGQVLLLGGMHAALRRRFRYPGTTVLLHPVGIACLVAIQWASGWRTFRKTSSSWKGRPIVARGDVR